jgi:dephospho-CoA kinase
MFGMNDNHPLVIALTGGIGSGKSTVAKLYATWGASVVDADDLAREVVYPGSKALADIVDRFGKGVLRDDGTLDRKKLGHIVFSDQRARTDLEQILHPLIRQRWLSLLTSLTQSGHYRVIVYAVPLLFESGSSYPEVEKIVLVTSPEDARIARICKRDQTTEENARARISSQLPDEEKAKRSDFVIRNDGTIDELCARAKEVWDSLVELAR